MARALSRDEILRSSHGRNGRFSGGGASCRVIFLWKGVVCGIVGAACTGPSSVLFFCRHKEARMIIGIDVGSAHADGVLLDGERLAAKNKVRLGHSGLEESVISLLRSLVPENRKTLERIHLSSTLCTNAIVTDSFEDVGMFIQAGPGVNPDFLACGENMFFLDGAIDHRGTVLRDPDTAHLEDSIATLREKGIESVGVVTKFSHRNKRHEQLLHDRLAPSFPHISLGHRISGLPNFPRRVYSTWLNAALQTPFSRFKRAIEAGLRELDIDCPCHILKADGGTFPFAVAREFPCESVYSGPSASVLGCLALKSDARDAILLDIGGTTTDISILADGLPLLEPYGITVARRPTLIRALNTKSVGLGGDSAVVFAEDAFIIGPEKKGAPVVLGGELPTPTDAMAVLGLLDLGKRERAVGAMEALCPGAPARETATNLLSTFALKVKEAVGEMIEEVFSRPVYTVSALLQRKKIQAGELVIIGGPAEALRDFLAESFQLPCTVPADFEVANAIGAARARLTLQATLYADTADGSLSIPEISCRESVGPRYAMDDARKRLREEICAMAKEMGMRSSPDVDFVEALEMNTVRGFQSTGKILSLKAQIRPGLEGVA